jgi:O-antigen ligase
VVRSVLAMSMYGRQLSGQAARTASWEPLLVTVIALVWLTTLVVDFRVALGTLMAIGFAAAVIGLRHPRLGLVGIGMLCTLNEIAAPLLLNAGGLWRWNTVNYWLVLVALLFLPYVLREGQLQHRVLQAFLLLLGVQVLVSPDFQNGIQEVLAVSAVFGILVYCRRAALDVDAWYWLGVASGVLAAGASAAYLVQEGRVPYVNQNAWPFAPLTAVFTICLALVVTDDARGRRRLVLALLAVLNVVWVFLSGSRGDFSIAVVGLAFLLTVMRLRRALSFGLLAALVSVAVMSQFTSLQHSAVERWRLLIDPEHALTVRTSGRFDLALGSWYIFKDHPFGVGTGGFGVSWADLGSHEGLSSVGVGRGSVRPAHSGWAQVLAENGVPGILLLGAYVLSFAVSGWRSRDPDLVRLGLLVTAALAVGWVSGDFRPKALWFLAAGATVLLSRRCTWNGRLRKASHRL